MDDKSAIIMEAIGEGRESVKTLIEKGVGITTGLCSEGIRYRLNKLVAAGHLVRHNVKPERRKLAAAQFGSNAPSNEYSKVVK